MENFQAEGRTQYRLFEYDFIRVVAMVFVIAVHALVVIDFADKFSLFYFNVMQAVFFSCNGIFFMISGRFALTSRQSYAQYYYKKLITIGMPVFIFFFIRTAYIASKAEFNNLFTQYLLNLSGALGNTEYWFLYVLIGNMMIAPLLAKAFRQFTKKECVLFLGLGLFYNLCVTISSVFGQPFEYSYLFGGWIFYFYLSYCLEKLLTHKRHVHLLWIVSSICLFITVVLKYKGITTYVHDLSPIFTVFTMGMYTMFLTIGTWDFPNWVKTVVRFLAKHSFSVYLIHMMVLETVIPSFPAIIGAASILRHDGVTLFVLIVSVIFSVIVDQLLLFPLSNLLLKLAKRTAA